MTNWNKKNISSEQIEKICSEYLPYNNENKNFSQILASILIRRGITKGKDLLYYLEDDLRFIHNPYLLNSMEDAVERILQAKEEGEKVLIFGDKDVDGITSTTILYDYLKKNLKMDVECRLPIGDDSYGLSIQAIDDFAQKNGTLIITVDCGISNYTEISHANKLGIDVIVTDHHNPQEKLPEAIIIIDPKLNDSKYPFADISGAAVSFKLVEALRFAQTNFYNSEICLIDLQKIDGEKYEINCLKIKNLCKEKQLKETINLNNSSIYNLKFPYFLQGQLIYVWNKKHTTKILNEIFGNAVEFNLFELQSEICQIMPFLNNKKCSDLVKLSKIGKYNKDENTIIDSLFNLYVTYCKKIIDLNYPNLKKDQSNDLQLVSLAALADVMPMKDENRIFVKNGINAIKNINPRPGIAELLNIMSIKKESLCSTDLSWTLIPALNAAGRMGQSNLSLELLTSEDPKQREFLSKKIYELNEERKNLVSKAMYDIQKDINNSINEYKNLCIIVNSSINKGVTGIVAARLMQENNIPSIVITENNNICIGSMRSCRGFISTDFLDSFNDFFINHGGHDFAAGFSFDKNKLPDFLSKCKQLSQSIKLEQTNTEINIDAEVPPQYLNPEIFNLLELFEPYGAENEDLILLSCNLKLIDVLIVGKKEPQHLKLTFDTGKYKIPGMFWGQAERLNEDIKIGRTYNILFNLSRNYFNGISTPQIIIKEMRINQ